MPIEIPIEIKKILSDFNITQEELLKIFSHLDYYELKRGDAFCTAGKICNKLGILIEGLLMAKFQTGDGKLNVSRFFSPPII